MCVLYIKEVSHVLTLGNFFFQDLKSKRQKKNNLRHLKFKRVIVQPLMIKSNLNIIFHILLVINSLLKLMLLEYSIIYFAYG